MRVALVALLLSTLGGASRLPLPVPMSHGTIVFVSEYQRGDRPTHSELAYVLTGTKTERLLYASGLNVRDPVLSPTRRLLAFTCIKGRDSEDGPRGPSSICVEDLRRRTVRTLGRGTSPSWSPDSRRLAFASRYGVGTVSVTGSDRRIVAAAHASSVDWSLDGTMLVASVGVEHATGLVVMRPDGSDAHALPIGGFDPAWSPDSRRIAYSDGFALWVADADGTDARELTRLDDDPSDDINADRYPAWSPDGSLVLYSHGLELWDALDTGVHGDDAVEPEPFSLSTVDVATGESTAIFYRGDGHVRADAEYEASWAR